MSTRDYLNQLKLIKIKLNNKVVEKEELIAMGTKITPSYSGMPGAGGVSDKVGDVAILLSELTAEIDEIMHKMLILKREILHKIEMVDDLRYYQILYKRYVEFKDFSVIAMDLHYTYQTTLNLHNKALKKLEDIRKNEEL